MTHFHGFATLTTPRDLLAKLSHDFARMEAAVADPYPALDFFVTAEHMLDWQYPDSASANNRNARAKLRASNDLLKITSHLANGVKHFKTTAGHHKSVGDVRIHDGGFASDAFDTGGFDTDRVVVELAGAEAKTLGVEIGALDLARRVLAYWKTQLP